MLLVLNKIKQKNVLSLYSQICLRREFKCPLPFSLKIQRVRFGIGFFKNSWRSKEYMITHFIKAAKTSQELQKMIQQRGQQMNIIHLTAILDHMSEEQMINTKKIAVFVVERLKMFEDELCHPTKDFIRALCNIICYLGNIKNYELNYIFQRVDYSWVLGECKVVEKVMLINGLIRLELFANIFQTVVSKDKNKALIFDSNLLSDLDQNQVVSIWLSFYFSKKFPINKEANRILLDRLNTIQPMQFKQEVKLNTYAYAVIFYAHMFETLQDTKLGRLHQIIKFHIPLRCSVGDFILPHELSLLLQSIVKLQRIHSQNKVVKSIALPQSFPDQFVKVLNVNFRVICQKPNTTLRNIANNFKGFNEASMKIEEETIKVLLGRMNAILLEEIKYVSRQGNKYNFDFKVDMLSLCNLFWKLNELKQCAIDTESMLQNLLENVQKYLMELNKIEIKIKLTANELLMLCSGCYLRSRLKAPVFYAQFQNILFSLVMDSDFHFSVKEVAMLFSYFRQMKIGNIQFCNFLRRGVKIDEKTVDKNVNLIKNLRKKEGCLMDLKQKCKGCFSNQRALEDF